MFGVDPGLLTGLALVNVEDRNDPEPLGGYELDVPSFYKFAEATISENAENLIVVCENYIITDRTAKLSQAPWSLRGCGVIEFLCLKHAVPFILQTPGDAKDYSTNSRLKATGFWHVGGQGHANDAYRHVMKYHADRSPRWTKAHLA